MASAMQRPQQRAVPSERNGTLGVGSRNAPELCGVEVAAADYRAVATRFHTVALAGVPVLSTAMSRPDHAARCVAHNHPTANPTADLQHKPADTPIRELPEFSSAAPP